MQMTRREVHLTQDEVVMLRDGIVPTSLRDRLAPENRRTKRCEACGGHSGNASATCKHCGKSFELVAKPWHCRVKRK